MDHVALVGLSGAGKSSVAPALAARWSMESVDTDAEVESAAGSTVAELFRTRGEHAFRVLEARALSAALDAPASVIATGGGVVLDAANRRILRDRAVVVWLRSTPEELAARLSASTGDRPLIVGDPEVAVRTLAQQRDHLYREVADVVVDVAGLGPDELVETIGRAVEDRCTAGDRSTP